MIRGRNIVCVASNWFDHPTSKHHVMRALSAHNDVLWVNYHASRRPRLTRGDARLALHRLWQARRRTQRVAPRIEVLSPLLIPMPAAPLARLINGRALRWQIGRALARLPRRPTQLWLFAPDIPELIDGLPAERVVYYCVDDFAAFSGYDTALVERLEARTMAAAHIVIATSTKLTDERRGRHPRVHLVPHGVDFGHFAATAETRADAVPADLRHIRRPIFGFMGMVSDYVDLELIAAAARARPDWSFVMLGSVRCDTGAIAGIENVHILGGRPYEQLPAYCRGFDVGLIPFRMNRLVRAVNPIKLREYLAAGLPVVSAPMESVLAYAPAVQVAENLGEFLRACQTALEMARMVDARARRDMVREESWRSRVELLSELVTALTPTGESAGGSRPEAPADTNADKSAAHLTDVAATV